MVRDALDYANDAFGQIARRGQACLNSSNSAVWQVIVVQQVDDFLVGNFACELVDVITAVNQFPTSPLTSLSRVLATTPSKPFAGAADLLLM